MKIYLKQVSFAMVLATVWMSGVAYASCPTELSMEELVSCIHADGAGQSYQETRAERAEIISQAQAARASTNQDIATKRQDVKSKDDDTVRKISASVKAK